MRTRPGAGSEEVRERGIGSYSAAVTSMTHVHATLRAGSGGWVVVVGICLLWGGVEGRAQSQRGVSAFRPDQSRQFCSDDPSGQNLDLAGLALFYCTTTPEITGPLQGAHATARPVFYGAVPAAWIGAGLVESRRAAAAAYRLTLTQGTTYGLVLGLKHAVARPRPYVPHSLTPREERYQGPPGSDAFLSFPSGHAGVSAALVTSWSLSYPRWYVIGPGAVWASGVALSRVYLGVHYPSDIVTGAALGVGVALLVHHFRHVVTPSTLRASPADPRFRAVPPLVLRVRF